MLRSPNKALSKSSANNSNIGLSRKEQANSAKETIPSKLIRISALVKPNMHRGFAPTMAEEGLGSRDKAQKTHSCQ